MHNTADGEGARSLTLTLRLMTDGLKVTLGLTVPPM